MYTRTGSKCVPPGSSFGIYNKVALKFQKPSSALIDLNIVFNQLTDGPKIFKYKQSSEPTGTKQLVKIHKNLPYIISLQIDASFKILP